MAARSSSRTGSRWRRLGFRSRRRCGGQSRTSRRSPGATPTRRSTLRSANATLIPTRPPRSSSKKNMVPQVRRSADQMENSEDTFEESAADLSMDEGDRNITLEQNSIRGLLTRRRGRGAAIDSERTGRSITRNDKLSSLRKRGIPLNIHFAREFGKVCGRHACIFKSEITVCVRQEAPLRVKKWKDIDNAFPGTMDPIWHFLKGKFPEISVQDYGCVMAQVQRQYNVRRYNPYKAYRMTKKHPSHVDPDDWQWLINKLWSDEHFQKRSKQNSVNRSKQELKSLVGTKSIVQIAHELKTPETGEWPSAMELWKTTYLKPNGTWSVPNGEEILNNLETVAETEKEKISSAAVPLVEHFALVLGRKPNHSSGVGVAAINQGAQERHRIHAQAQAAQQRADDAQQHAAALLEEIQRLTEASMQLQDELQSQREELSSQRRTVEAQSGDMERLMDQKHEERMNAMLARVSSVNGVSFPPASSRLQ